MLLIREIIKVFKHLIICTSKSQSCRITTKGELFIDRENMKNIKNRIDVYIRLNIERLLN